MIAETACRQLISLHDPAILCDAVSPGQTFDCQLTLCEGLSTPAGSAALLRRIGNTRVPLDMRIAYADMLGNIDIAYQRYGQRQFNVYRASNGRFLTHVAHLALINRKQEDLCLTLLSSLHLLFDNIHHPDDALTADMRSTLSVLKTLQKITKSEKVKEEVKLIDHAAGSKI